MSKVLVILVTFAILSVIGKLDNFYHERSKIKFHPERSSEYFGYSVLLDFTGLLVGAPRSKSRDDPSIRSGIIFNCSLSNLEINDVTCYSSVLNRGLHHAHFFKNDMWIGATIAKISNDTLLMCTPYSKSQSRLGGVCAAQMGRRGQSAILAPFDEKTRQFYYTNATTWRNEYREITNKLEFYLGGQLGMSTKVISSDSFIIGAPGLLERTGGIVEYKYRRKSKRIVFEKKEIPNLYYTKQLGSDDYFGYSVESGVFDDSQNILFVAGAPRSKSGYGQVLIFEPVKIEREPLNIRAAVEGPHMGSYFGAAICCTDIDGDGKDDLLVGAPNFVRNEKELSIDEGAVFVFMTRRNGASFMLDKSNYVLGSGKSGARFGTTIADLGDIDGDGFPEIAIGAPWENNGSGVVYIYSCNSGGLNSHYSQTIFADKEESFGISISKGLDIDGNRCNDLAVGAYKSDRVYVYRCVPTIKIIASIKILDTENLTKNSLNFTASFCIAVSSHPRWTDLKTDWYAVISLDSTETRARVVGESSYSITINSGSDTCVSKVIQIFNNTDFSMPIEIEFDVESASVAKDTPTFPTNAVRLSEDSILHSLKYVPLTENCGEDFICTPYIDLDLKAWITSFVPGTKDSIGFNITICNNGEPAYGVTVKTELPLPPKRIPNMCTLQETNLTCTVPPAFITNVTWDIELDQPSITTNLTELRVKAVLEDVYGRNISDGPVKEVVTSITPKATFMFKGLSMPNISLKVERTELKNVLFTHYFEVINYGPSYCKFLITHIRLPQEVVLLNKPNDCLRKKYNLECFWTMPAKSRIATNLNYLIDLNFTGQSFDDLKQLNFTTKVVFLLEDYNQTHGVETLIFIQDTFFPWHWIGAGAVLGLIVLGLIVYVCSKFGFFTRLRNYQNQEPVTETNICSAGTEDGENSNGSDQPEKCVSDDIELTNQRLSLR